MAKKPDPQDAPANFDDLLGSIDSSDAPADDTTTVSENESQETPEEKRIRELEAELAKPLPASSDEPVFEPEAEKTPEQIRIEDLEAQLAERNARILESTPETFAPVQGDAILMHIVEDGFNQFGRVWYRGQEIRLSSKDYEETKDRFGNSWVDTMLNDPHAQFAKWGHVYIAPGPFVPRPGEVFTDHLVKEDARRKGAVPTLSTRD